MNRYLIPLLATVCFWSQADGAPVKSQVRDGVLSGAYMDFGETEDAVTLEGIEAFEKLVQKNLPSSHPPVIGENRVSPRKTSPSSTATERFL
jgi:hypothetical protein